jgi:hypothetical protein
MKRRETWLLSVFLSFILFCLGSPEASAQQMIKLGALQT